MLHCIAYKEKISQSIHLQQPYIESHETHLVGHFLYLKKKNIKEKKALLFVISKKRQHQMKTVKSGNT